MTSKKSKTQAPDAPQEAETPADVLAFLMEDHEDILTWERDMVDEQVRVVLHLKDGSRVGSLGATTKEAVEGLPKKLSAYKEASANA